MTESLNILNLFAQASLVVQLVILLLMLFSVLSWMIIFERWSFLSRCEEELKSFESFFWSGIEIDEVYEIGSDKEENSIGAEYLFRAGFEEYKKLNSENIAPEVIFEGVEVSSNYAPEVIQKLK